MPISQRVEKLKSSPRVQRLLKRNWDAARKPSISIDRARLVTASYRETEALPMVIRRAKAFEKIVKEISIAIDSDELIVGSEVSEPMTVILAPEAAATEIMQEIDNVDTREYEPYRIHEEDRGELKEKILPYWKEKTIFDKSLAGIPDEYKRVLWEEPWEYPLNCKGLLDAYYFMERAPGTNVPNPRALEKNLKAIRMQAASEMARSHELRKRHFYEAVVICCDAAIDHAKRYAKLARDMAEKESDAERKRRLQKIAEVCEWVPENSPRTFQEAVQFEWFLFYLKRLECPANGDSIGRIDQYLYPYYKRDMDEGRLTDEEAFEIVQNLFLKMDSIIWWLSEWGAKNAGSARPMHLELAGRTADGKDATNELSYMMVHACELLKTQNPNVRVYLHRDVSEDFWRKACKCIVEGGLPTFWNTDLIIQCMIERGCSLEEARTHAGVDCFMPVIPGKDIPYGNPMGKRNIAGALLLALHNGVWRGEQIGPRTGDPADFKTFEELMEAFEKQFEFICDIGFEVYNEQLNIQREILPLPFISALTDSCIEKGRTVQEGGAFYTATSVVNGLGIIDTADSFTTIKKFVYDEKKMTMAELIDAIDANFEGEGQEELRLTLRNMAPKYGNDDDEADMMVRELVSRVARIVRKEKYDFHPYGANVKNRGITLSSFTSGMAYGRLTPALPSGRKAGEPFSVSYGPVHGCDVKGPTAVLKSMSKIDHVITRAPTLLNLTFTPDTVRDLGKFAPFLKAFVELNCAQVQFNILSTEMLRDAQEHPENYPNLFVRVSGYNASFTRLPKEIQEDVINRTEHRVLF